MKPQLLKVPRSLSQSFSIRQDVVPYFYNRWHYHSELELVLIQRGCGTQFVGDSILHFSEGDLLLIGANLPHYWRCEEKYFRGDEDLYAQSTVVHFAADVLGECFLKLPENHFIKTLIEKARRGIKFNGEVSCQAKVLLQNLLDQKNGNRILSLIQILETLAQCTEIELLSNSFYQLGYDEIDTDRINSIYKFALTNFQRKITIEEAAEVANISPHSFCRYFKSRSRKTFSQFLLELRIGNACKLLIEGRLSVTQISYESGFYNLANFNRSFRVLTAKSPIQYQKEYNLKITSRES